MGIEETDKPIGRGESQDWNWNPALPIPVSPIFAWPPKPLSLFRWMAGYWLAISSIVIELLLALTVWWLTQPSFEIMQQLSLSWALTIWFRNLVLLFIVAGSLHVWLWHMRGQGSEAKFDKREMAQNNGHFAFRNQVYDNMFWSVVSGVTIWTAFEVCYFWSAANGFAPVMTLIEAPVSPTLTTGMGSC